jgi:hypothetical protein
MPPLLRNEASEGARALLDRLQTPEGMAKEDSPDLSGLDLRPHSTRGPLLAQIESSSHETLGRDVGVDDELRAYHTVTASPGNESGRL